MTTIATAPCAVLIPLSWRRQHTLSPITALVSGLTALALLPLLLVRYPAEVDYLNHLARMHLIADWWRGVANPFYLVRWRMLPNLAADLLVPPIGLLIGVEAALKLFAVVAKLLIVTGAIALERRIRGRHLLAGLGALLTLYNRPFSWGLVNFEFGVGVALWAMTAWVALRDRRLWRRGIVHAAFTLLLFACHFLALGIYGIFIGLLELARLTNPSKRRALHREVALSTIMAGPVLLLLALTQASGGAIGGATTEWAFGAKLLWPLLFMNADHPLLAAATMLGLLLSLAVLVARRRIGLTREGAFVATGLVMLYLAMPRQLFETDMIDIRLLVPFFLVLPAFIELPHWTARGRQVAACFVGALILLNVAQVTAAWHRYDRAAAELRTALAGVPRHSMVLVARSPAAPESLASAPLIFVPTLAVADIDAFTPSLYIMPGVQPVTARPALQRLRIQRGVDYRLPAFAALAAEVGQPGSSGLSYIRSWTRDFDALVLLGPPGPNPLPGLLRPAGAGTDFRIYRVAR